MHGAVVIWSFLIYVVYMSCLLSKVAYNRPRTKLVPQRQ